MRRVTTALLVLVLCYFPPCLASEQERPRFYLAEKVASAAPAPHREHAAKLIRIFDRVAAYSPISATLLYSPQQQFNAAAFTNKGQAYVVFYAPLLHVYRDDEDAIAYVVAHELAHHSQKHTTRGADNRAAIAALANLAGAFVDYNLDRKNSRNTGVGRLAGQVGGAALVAGYTRDQEREADQAGLQMMSRAGFNPEGAIRAQRVMAKLSREKWFTLFDTHPSSPERAANLEAQIKSDPVVIAAMNRVPASNVASASSLGRNTPGQDGSLSGSDGASAIANLKTALAEADRIGKAGDSKAGAERLALEYDNAMRLASNVNSDADRIAVARVLLYGNRSSVEGVKKALNLLMDVRQGERPEVQYLIGYAYFSGGGGDHGKLQAGAWMMDAAKQGFAPAQYALASLYERGSGGVTQSRNEAIKWYQSAAAQGHRQAQSKLSQLQQ
jgi:Zn-dependent protease with chaperone function